MIYGEIICIGDSLTQGSRDKTGRGYPFYLETMISEEYDQTWICHNHGVAGDTSFGVLQRAYTVMRSYPEAKEVVINCGMNDAKTSEALGEDDLRQHLGALLRRAGILEKRVYLTNIPAVKGFGAPDNIDEALLSRLNAVIEEAFWERPDVHRVDWRDIDEDLYQDGVHFTAGGYRLLAERVKESIESVRGYGLDTASE